MRPLTDEEWSEFETEQEKERKQTMKTFYVTRKEVHDSIIKVEAQDEQDAIQLVKEDGGEEISTEYSRTLPSDQWTVEEKKVD
jgi:hypothetical protein